MLTVFSRMEHTSAVQCHYYQINMGRKRCSARKLERPTALVKAELPRALLAQSS